MANLSNAAVISLSVTLTLLTVLVIALVVAAVHHSAWRPGSRRSGSGSSSGGSHGKRIMQKVSEARLSTPRLRRYSGSKLIGRDPLQESINWSNSSGGSGDRLGKRSRSVDSLPLTLPTSPPPLAPSKQLVPLSCHRRCHSVDVGTGGRGLLLLTVSETLAIAAAAVTVEAEIPSRSQ